MNKVNLEKENIGLDLAVLGSVITCAGVIANNLMLDPLLARQIWMFSNPIFCAWAVGIWRHWWDGGLSGLVMSGMYGFFTATNLWSLM